MLISVGLHLEQPSQCVQQLTYSLPDFACDRSSFTDYSDYG